MDGYDPLHDLNHGMSLMLILAICALADLSVHGRNPDVHGSELVLPSLGRGRGGEQV